jgi:hypothetical protein
MRGWYDSNDGRLNGEKINTTEIEECRIQFCKFRSHHRTLYNQLGYDPFVIYKHSPKFDKCEDQKKIEPPVARV